MAAPHWSVVDVQIDTIIELCITFYAEGKALAWMNDALHKFVPETVFTGESKQLLLDTLTVKEEDFAPRDVGYELKLLAKRAKNSVSRKQS